MRDEKCRRNAAIEREEESYRALFQQVDEQMRLEYERDFGPTYRSMYPYRTDGPAVHKIVAKMMRSGWE